MTPFSTETPVLLAPMAGYTDSAFRILCRSFGCDLAYTEMVSAKGLHFLNARTELVLSIDADEPPVAVQLFGSDPAIMGEQAERLCDLAGDRLVLIDLNMGCPAQKIVKNGDGCALMRDLPLAARVIEQAARHSRVPVTVKFRKGWDAAHENAADFARMAEQSGAAALTVHGRTREQQYGGAADLACIAAVKQAVSIPVIGNGDVRDGASAKRMLTETGCDGVMIGRGALGNPFVFAAVKSALAGLPHTPPDRRARMALALKHAEMTWERKGENGLVELRKHIPFYFAGFPGAARLRVAANNVKTLPELRRLLLDTDD